MLISAKSPWSLVRARARARWSGLGEPLDLPSLEDWADEFKNLTPAQVERISSPEFYDFLRVRITRKYLALK